MVGGKEERGGRSLGLNSRGCLPNSDAAEGEILWVNDPLCGSP